MKRAVWLIGGILCVLVGIVGLVLPGIQGIAMIVLGLSLIAPRFTTRIQKQIFRKFYKSDLVYFKEWKKQNIEAGFTTKHFPLKLSKMDDLKDENKLSLFLKYYGDSKVTVSNQLQVPNRLILLNQVHGNHVAVLEREEAFIKPGLYPITNADGALTNVPGLTLLVFSADCLPIFLSAGEWVGLVHAGWRGTKDKIASTAVGMLSECSGIPAAEIKALFGPCIGKKHYEVGEEFTGFFSNNSLTRKKGKLYFDLAKENEKQLIGTGVLPKNISDHGICTYAEKENFYSFRREGSDAGRMISFISRGKKTN